MADLFLITGNLEQYFTDFGLHYFLLPPSASKLFQISGLAKDRPRTRLFSTIEDQKKFNEIWSEKTKETRTDQFIQGNPTAANLFGGFNHNPHDPLSEQFQIPYAFFKKEELAEGAQQAYINVQNQLVNIKFSYFDDKGQTRGLTIFYRKDDPSKWMIALTANANRSPELADAMVLTPFNSTPWSRLDGQCNIDSQDAHKLFIDAIDSKKLESFMSQVIDKKGNLNPNANVLNLFTQPANESFEANDSLMNNFNVDILENEAFIKLSNHLTLKPSVASLERCLNENSKLYQAVKRYEIGSEERQNQRDLGLLLFIDKYSLWGKQDILLKDEEIAEIYYSLLLQNSTNTKILQFLASCLESDLKISGLKFLMKAVALAD